MKYKVFPNFIFCCFLNIGLGISPSTMVGIIFTLILSQTSFGQELDRRDPYWSTYNMHFYEFDRYARRMSQALSHGRAPETSLCTERYDDLYRDGRLDIVVGFGYTDETEIVRDPLSSRAFAAHLKQPCQDNYELCGFKVIRDWPMTLVKTIRDPYKGPVTVSVTVVAGGYSPDDKKNRTVWADRQERQSRMAEEAFFVGARTAHVVLYSGHSRNGGGPDFRPPKMRGHHVDYPYYETHRPGVKALVNNLKMRTRPLDLFGMFSCYSKGHFTGVMKANSPGTGLIFGYGESWFNSDTLIAGAINGLLRRSCQGEFDIMFREVEHNGRPQFILSDFWRKQSI